MPKVKVRLRRIDSIGFKFIFLNIATDMYESNAVFLGTLGNLDTLGILYELPLVSFNYRDKMAFNIIELPGQMMVCRIGSESRIFNRAANGEMVQALIVIIFDSQNFMDSVVEKTTDAGAANTMGFSFKI